ncbi:unnamed protein product [Medioppia subpectinata]|uniref:Uncharacterized protein n=1 Tax=Medioppia subpectinata TaxID=1979941 RepID=A0A7R9KN65_9ACAR|nr:unnamed protein product [Medioppia subpectinata]CAG2106646.1 unnamed protein product [Medioppia subpectinata]
MSSKFNIFFFSLLVLTLSSLVLSEEPDKCVDKCKCFSVGENRPEMDCTRQNLSVIPGASEWPKNIFALDISMNQLKRIDVMDSSDSLEYLDLASNAIETIEPNAFEKLTQLRGLDLSHNELMTLPTELFTDKLLTLNLSYNNIEILPNDLLKKILDSDLLRYSGQLKALDLSAISSFALKDDIFHQLFELTELDLSDNDFMLVPTIPLRSARNLKVLKLSKNPIRVLDEHSFVKMHTLTELYLDEMNELIEVKEKTFSYLFNLKKISISNNPHLSYIDSYAFYGTFNRSWIALKEANFRANRLSTLPENTLPFCNLTTLDLRENPWTCDCHLLWAKYCHLRPELTHGIICANPAALRGHDLIMVDHHNIHCEQNQIYREVKMMRLFVIVFVSFTLFFIGLLFVLFIKRDLLMRWWTDRRRGTGAIYYVKAHSNPIEPEF